MLKVVAFMKQVAKGLQMEGNFGTAHVYRSSLNAIIAYRGKGDFTFHEVTPEWLKGFEIHLRGRGCSWNTVSTYLRTFRAVYNRAVDCRGAVYVPHLFRSVYTGTRADRKRALDTEDMQKVFAKLPSSPAVTPAMRRTQELFVLMFLLRGLPFVDLAYLRKSDLHDNVITYRRRKTGRPLSVTLTPEAMAILKRYMNRDTSSPYLWLLFKIAFELSEYLFLNGRIQSEVVTLLHLFQRLLFVFAQSFRNIHTDIYDKVSCAVSVTLYGRQPLASQAYHLARLCARFYFDFYFSIDGRDFRIAAQCRSGDIQK